MLPRRALQLWRLPPPCLPPCCALRSLSTAPASAPLPDAAPGAPTTHFGFQTVDASSKAALVGDVFKRVAASYDLMNDLMSGTLHRLWKDEFVRMVGPLSPSRAGAQTVCLDVAGGTGDIAFRLVEQLRSALPLGGGSLPPPLPHVIVCDINPAMLGVGRERADARGYHSSAGATIIAAAPAGVAAGAPQLSWVEGDAEALPIASDSVDLYTIAFGIRNVTRVDQALREAFRVLKPGGRFMCLEFSRVEDPVLRQVYDAVRAEVVAGRRVRTDSHAYTLAHTTSATIPRSTLSTSSPPWASSWRMTAAPTSTSWRAFASSLRRRTLLP